jgi:hypothetical protein
MRFLSSVILLLSILLLFFVFGSIWSGCSPRELVHHVRTLLASARQQEALDREFQVVLERTEERIRVMEAIAAGKLTLFEAAKRFERVGLSPASLLDERVRDRPRDEAGWCRMVLRCVHTHLTTSPRRSRVLPPLVQAYRQRFGELPAELARNLQPFSKLASDGG